MSSDDPHIPFAIRPLDRATFSAMKAAKTDLWQGEHLFVGLNCFEPGQSQPTHAHVGADKFYLILSGKARMSVGGSEWIASAGDLVAAPDGVPHGVVTALEQTVMLVGMSTGKHRTDR